MSKIESFPSMNEVEAATHVELARWWRFLRRPKNEEERIILNRIYDRYEVMGALPPAISREIDLEWYEKG